MKTFQYVGGPAQTGATLRDGTQLLMHKGRCYILDESSEYIRTLLAKRNANGMTAPWLVEVETPPEANAVGRFDSTEEPEKDEQQTVDSEQNMKRRK